MDDQGKPEVGMVVNTIEEAWNLWENYGRQTGFGVRKHYANKSKKDGLVTSATFVCAREGHRGEDKRLMASAQHRWETRTDCKARLLVSLVRASEKYTIKGFIEEHNHTLEPLETTHMFRSYRKVSQVQALAIDLACDSGIKPKATHELLTREAGGRGNLGYTMEDHKTYLRSRRQRSLLYGEAGCMLRYFQEQVTKNPSFHYAIQLDSEEQVTNIFWADPRMIIDYSAFGDVVIFDTTYGTNKELRPLGVFTGFNHHREMVIFGAALFYFETAESFKWLFESFLNAHNGKKFQTIFTDQDAAMAKALAEVMPDTCHGLCTWHIMQNGIKHLGNHMKDGSSFLRQFKACMFHYEDEKEFENAWLNMVHSYSLENNHLLIGIYRLRAKWAKCYMRNSVTLGIQSTQLSESLNSDLKAYLKCDLNIGEFFHHFERVVEQKRQKELEAEFRARQKVPCLGLTRSPIFQQASKVYTPRIFKLFHEEYDIASGAKIKMKNDSLRPHEFIVVLLHDMRTEFKVLCDPIDETISCSCKKFDTFGILCCHALKVFNYLDVMAIPKMYILKRWTREAKSEYVLDNKTPNVKEDVHHWVSRVTSQFLRLIYRASERKESCDLVEALIKDCNKQIDSMVAIGDREVQSIPNDTSIHCQSGENPIGNIKGLKKRDGRKGTKRMKPWVEKKLGKRRKSSNKKIDNFDSHFASSYKYQGTQGRTCESDISILLSGPSVCNSLLSSSQASNNTDFTLSLSGTFAPSLTNLTRMNQKSLQTPEVDLEEQLFQPTNAVHTPSLFRS